MEIVAEKGNKLEVYLIDQLAYNNAAAADF